MHRSYLTIAFGLFVVCAFGIQPALAAGNVLLPSNNGDSGGTSNFNPYLPQETKPQEAPADNKPSTAAQNPMPDMAAAPAQQNPLPELKSGGYSPIPGGLSNYLPPSANTTTQVLKLPDDLSSSPTDASLPYTLNVDIARDSQWAANDIQRINYTFGYKPEEIPAHCRISLGGFVQTDKSIYMFSTGVSLHTTVKFDGTIKGVTAQIRSLCDPVPLPANRGGVIQLGDKYVLMVGNAQCPQPSRSPHGIVVHYSGNNSAQCVYQ